MSSLQSTSHTAGLCPHCHKKGKGVNGQTIKSLLAVSLREIDEEAGYFFCGTQSCPIVYFAGDGQKIFNREHIRVPVYQKEPDNPAILICYCFQYSVEDIKHARAEEGQAIIEDINQGIRAGQCACDLRNPQGSCCLGNISKMLKPLE